MRIVDLSIAIEHGLPSDPPIQIPQIEYLNHTDTAQQMANFFKGATIDDLPEGQGWGIEFVKLCTHSGTHVDAPYHFYPTMNGGEPAWTIDQVPLDWFMGNGVVMDFHDKPDGYKITQADVEEYFKKVNYTIKPGDIVLLRTDADDRWGTPEYLVAGPGMSYDATLWLLNQGVRVTGTDGWSWDVPLPFEGEEFARTGDASIIWEGHRAGREKAYCHIEKMTNLDQLPLTGFQVICLPVNIKAASAGWSRVIAILD